MGSQISFMWPSENYVIARRGWKVSPNDNSITWSWSCNANDNDVSMIFRDYTRNIISLDKSADMTNKSIFFMNVKFDRNHIFGIF